MNSVLCYFYPYELKRKSRLHQ